MSDLIDRIARTIEGTMFAPHELPVSDDLHARYRVTAAAALTVVETEIAERTEACARVCEARAEKHRAIASAAGCTIGDHIRHTNDARLYDGLAAEIRAVGVPT